MGPLIAAGSGALLVAGVILLVAGLGAAQFAAPGTIDALRSFREPDASAVRVLAAVDPANPFGWVLPWPAHDTARPSRLAGAVVVIADGSCLAHLGRGGRSLTLFPSGSPAAAAALRGERPRV